MTPRLSPTRPSQPGTAASSSAAAAAITTTHPPASDNRPGTSRQHVAGPPLSPRSAGTGGAGSPPRAYSPLPEHSPEVASLITGMSMLSDVRRKRLLHKSASEQYQFAKRLSPLQRGELERALAAEVRRQPGRTEARAALAMWMSVQQARLRTHDAVHRRQHDANQASALELAVFGITLPVIPFVMASQRRSYYRSPARAEYATAFDNFMRMLRDPDLPPELRATVAERLDYHRRSEGTIAPRQAELLRMHGAEALAASGYLVAADPDLPVLSSTDRLVLTQREAAAARGGPAFAAPGLPPGSPPSRWKEVLTLAVGTLTGTHPADIDLSGTMDGGQRQAVIDHLHDLGDHDLTPRAEAVRAVRAARGDVQQIVARMLEVVKSGVLSSQTEHRAALARQHAAMDAARRAAGPAADRAGTRHPAAPQP